LVSGQRKAFPPCHLDLSAFLICFVRQIRGQNYPCQEWAATRHSHVTLQYRSLLDPRHDETYIKVYGHWRYLYRAIDGNGPLVDVMFSEDRDMAAAKAFFQSAKIVTDVTPDRVTTDGHDSYPRAIRTTLGEGVKHRTSRYLNNRLEQDHRGCCKLPDRTCPLAASGHTCWREL
jgi:hypothetical protein